MTRSDGEDEEPPATGRGNLFALIGVVVLVALGYWAFHYIDQQRKLQDCLDFGAPRLRAARVRGEVRPATCLRQPVPWTFVARLRRRQNGARLT